MSMTILKDNMPILLIDRHIGEDAMYGVGVTGSDFVRELNMIENAGYKQCEVWVNSIGGSVMDAMQIYHAISSSSIEVNTRNIGVAASSAGWIMQAGKKRIGNYYSQLMMHPSSGGGDKALDAIDQSIVAILANRCKKSENWINERLKEETWMSAEEAYNIELYDEVDYSCGVEIEIEVNNKSAFAAYNSLKGIVNKLIENKPKKKVMKKLFNSLNLTEDATEESALKEVEALKKQIEDLSNKVKEKEDFIKAENDKKEAERIEREAVEFVENAINEGRIEKETKDSFVNLAKLNLEGTKEAINKMPVKKVANKLPITGVSAENRDSWDYDKWQKEDPKGLQDMYTNAREHYDLILNNWLKNKK